jgi:copper(I)-binding protein
MIAAMPLVRRILAFSLAAAVSAPAWAVFSVTEPWVRAHADGRTAEVFLKLRTSEPLTLVAVDSFAARKATLEGADKRRLERLDLPANQPVELKASDARIRLSGLVRKLRMGEYVPLTLVFRGPDGSTQNFFVNAEVRLHSPLEDEMSGHHHGGQAHGK